MSIIRDVTSNLAAIASEATAGAIKTVAEAVRDRLPAAFGAGGGIKVDGSGTALPVSGTFWQATQPVSGTVTANEGTSVAAADAGPKRIVSAAGQELFGPGDTPGDINLATIAGSAPAAANPAPVRLSDGAAYYDARSIRALSSGTDSVSATQGTAAALTGAWPFRPTHEFYTDAANGDFPNYTVQGKFGAASGIDTTERDIWALGAATAYPWPTAGTTVRIKAGGNVNDTSAGTGARAVVVVGLKASDWTETSETIVTAGASASSATTTSFIRIYRAYVATVGTYGGANAGDIDIENSAGGTTLARIPALLAQTRMTMYTIPAGYKATLAAISIVPDSSKAITLRFYQRQNADTVGAPYTSKRIVREFPNIISPYERTFFARTSFPAKTDLWFTGFVGSATGAVAVGYDLILEAV